MNRRSMVGFDRRLRLDWLDFAAAKAAEGQSPDQLRECLLARLGSLSHTGESGSARAKTARVLLRVWGNVTPETRGLHDRALDLIGQVSPKERLIIHWAMMIAVYPFFTDVAAILGRLLRLQGSVSLSQIRRRIQEQWGERSTVARASQRVIRSMVDWGVLVEKGTGVYSSPGTLVRVAPKLGVLLLEGLLLDADEGTLTLNGAIENPALFPFSVQLNALDLQRTDRVELFREGFETELVTVRGQ